MLELQAVQPDVVGCYGQVDALDRLNSIGNGGRTLRIAPTELLVLGERGRVGDLEAELTALDPTSLVIDLSSAFSIWALGGDDRHEALCRLSEVEVPQAPALVQGLVAHVPARMVVLDNELLVLVSSALTHHVRERVLAVCADLEPVEAPGVRSVLEVVDEAALA